MPDEAPLRCAELSRALVENPAGTAAPIGSVLLIEYPGPWPKDAAARVLDELLDADRRAQIDHLRGEHGLRPLLIRRPGRGRATDHPSVLIGGCRRGARWMERLDRRELPGLDLEEVATGVGGIGEPVTDPQLLVCTHGRKDACCAVRGRPVVAALAGAYPEQAWECSHVGGDRFAGILFVVPHGLMYGMLDPIPALRTVAAIHGGEVPIANMRGRCGLTPFEQVAEIEVRRLTGLTGLDAVRAYSSEESGSEEGDDEAQVLVDAAGESVRIRLRRRPLGPCGTSSCAGALAPTTVEVVEVSTLVRH